MKSTVLTDRSPSDGCDDTWNDVWTWISLLEGGGVRVLPSTPATSIEMSQFDDESTLFADGLFGCERRVSASLYCGVCALSNRRGDIMIILSGPASDLCHGIESLDCLDFESIPILLKSGGIVAIHPAIIPKESSMIALTPTALHSDISVLVNGDR